MKKRLAVLLVGCLAIAACGGGGSGSNDSGGTAATKKLTVSMYGNPLSSGASTKVARAQFSLISAAVADESPNPASAAQATVQTLEDALTSRGVPAQVTLGVMDGTTLHQIVMGENNGLPPTNDQFKTEPSEWIVVNFQLDDMFTKADDPVQLAAVEQFAQDLYVFNQRAAVVGKRVFAIMPILTCDIPNHNTASDALMTAIAKAAQSSLTPVGGIDYSDQVTAGHMGSDCRMPDAYVQNLHIQKIADDLAGRYQGYLNGT